MDSFWKPTEFFFSNLLHQLFVDGIGAQTEFYLCFRALPIKRGAEQQIKSPERTIAIEGRSHSWDLDEEIDGLHRKVSQLKNAVELDFLYPSEGIHRRWDNGYRITSIVATPDQAAFILSKLKKNLPSEVQETLRTSAFPSSHVTGNGIGKRMRRECIAFLGYDSFVVGDPSST